MPIDRVSKPRRSGAMASICFLRSAIALKSAAMRSVSSVLVAIPISPHIWVARRLSKRLSRKYASISSGVNPNLVSSAATCTCISTRLVMPSRALSASMASSTRSESTLSISAIGPASSSLRTLFVWRWPMKCHRMSAGSAGIFADNSCTRLSPKMRCPAE
ncbi:hypothetical protein IMSAGC008_02359 [Muribaculaceae bacterium]|nr:hypothetical protein IMSAGC008_02359 [Muribaculaceae bacterium]